MKNVKITLGFIAAGVIIITILFLNRSSRESQIDKAVLEDVTVSVAPAAEETVSDNLSIIGTVESNNDVMVISETQGKTLKVFIKTGDRVSEGAPIALIDDELKQAAFMTAKVNLEKARKDLQRIEALYKEKNVSDSDLENARLGATAAEAQYIAANRQLNDTKIKAPISGLIADKYINQGTMVAPGTPVANIIDISKLKVRINIPEKEVFKIRTGDVVSLKTDVYPGINFKGKIETISSKADNAHTYPVEVMVSNDSSNPLKAGMFMQADFTNLGKRQTLTIPRTAIISSIKDPRIYVVENGIARIRNIVAGKEADNKIEVLGGLRAGEKVVVNGQNNLSDNMKVVEN